jgi:hypothetical protein
MNKKQKMKNLILILCMFSCFNSSWAQSATEMKLKISDVKESDKYFYADATKQDKEEALSAAKEQLVLEINQWLKSKQSDATVKPVDFEEVKTKVETADMKRGNSVRVFIYVDKNDIILIRGLNAIVLGEDEKEVKPDPIPVAAEKSPLQLIYEAKTMEEMQMVFSELKEKNLISYSALPAGNFSAKGIPSNCYLLFFTQTGKIKGVVSIDEKEILRNVQTQEEIKGKYFDGCGAYWFTLKDEKK